MTLTHLIPMLSVPLPPTRALRLLMVTPRFQPYAGGIETHVAEVGQRLAARGHQVTVLTTRPDVSWPAQERCQGVEVVRVHDWLAGRDAYLAPTMARWIATREWDVIHYQGCATLVPPVTMWATRRLGIPFVVTLHLGGHSAEWRNRFRQWQWRIMGASLRQARRLIAVSRYEADHFAAALALPTERFAIIPNGIPDLTALVGPPPAREPGLIVSIGRLERYKGHQRLIAALPQVLTQLPHARLEILGAGPHEPDLHRLADELGVAAQVRIRYIPPGQRHELIRTLQQAQLATLLSERESHPIAIMEALTCGCAALVNDTTGLHELGEAGLATTVPPTANAATVAQAVIAQLRQPHVPARGRLPTWDRCVTELEAIYRAAI